MPDYRSIAEAFARDGYVVVDDFFDADMMDRCTRAIHEHYGDVPSPPSPDTPLTDAFIAKSATEVTPWNPLNDGVESFSEIDDHAGLRNLTTQVLGEGWVDMICMVMMSRPGSRGQAWHQDCPPERPQAFNLNRLVYTHDIDPANGGQAVVMPGSHRKGVVPAGDPHESLEGEVTLTPKRGTLVLLHGHTWHRVTPIVGDKPRASTNLRVVPKDVPTDVTDIGVYRTMRYRFSTREVVEDRE